jgi:predicted AAA+ superfamily ATPase
MVIQKILNEKIIDRNFYLDKIKKYLNTPLIKVLIWQRRVGKSTILKSIIQKLVWNKKIKKQNIFYINKELPFYANIKDYNNLKDSFSKFKNWKEWKFLICIDEIQEIYQWERFINWLLAEYQENIEIFITWSNSFLLSWELSTYLTWRYIEFNIFPLSFEEFCIFKNEKQTKQNFIEHLKYGWLPAIFKIEYSEEMIFSYLLWVYNTIVLKDIIQYHQIKNISFFKDLYKYTLSNIWNIISWKSIKDYLKSQKIRIWNETVLNFLQYALETFILYKTYSVEPETKRYFEIYNKYYAWDLWLRNALVWFNPKNDIWKLIENYVFLELKRNWYEIKIWRLKSWKEIDFIATKNGITKHFQVCYLLWSEETMRREYASLEEIKDNWEKFVISFDDIDFWNYKWIKHINVMKLNNIL